MSGPSPTVREKCFEEWGEECLGPNCSVVGRDNLHVHHLDQDDENDGIENIRPFCQTCHHNIHYGREGYEQWSEHLEALQPTASQRSAPGKVETKEIAIRPDQIEYLRENRIDFSRLARDWLDDMMREDGELEEFHGGMLKAHRLAQGLTIDQLADEVGVNPAAVKNWESEEWCPSDENYERLVTILDREFYTTR